MKKRQQGNDQWTLRIIALCVIFFSAILSLVTIYHATAGASSNILGIGINITLEGTPGADPSPNPEPTPSPTKDTTPTPAPTPTKTAAPKPTPTPTQVAQPTIPPVVPPAQVTPTPTATAKPKPTATATATPTPVATQAVESTPTTVSQPVNTDQTGQSNDGGISLLLPIGGGIGFMVLTAAAVVLVLLLKRKQDEKARQAQQLPLNIPWIDPQEGNVVFGAVTANQNSNTAVNDALQNIFAEPGHNALNNMSAVNSPHGGNSGVMPAIAPSAFTHGNSGMFPAMPTMIEPTPQSFHTSNPNNQYATLEMSEQDQTNPRSPAIPSNPALSDAYATIANNNSGGTGSFPPVPSPTQPAERSSNSQPLNFPVEKNLQPLSMDLPPELQATLEASSKHPRPSNGPLSFSGLQEDPFLEEMMQQAQMGIFVMPKQDKTGDSDPEHKRQ